MWLDAIAHIQVTYSPEVEDAMLFFYSKVLGLTEIDKPEAIKANGGAWYVLGDIQVHLSIEKNPSNATSRRHICYLVRNARSVQATLTRTWSGNTWRSPTSTRDKLLLSTRSCWKSHRNSIIRGFLNSHQLSRYRTNYQGVRSYGR